MRTVISLFCVLILLSACKKPREEEISPYKTDPVIIEDLTYAIHKHVADIYDTEFDLHVCHAYICFHEGRYYIWADFYTQELLEIIEARHLLVRLIDGLIDLATDISSVQLDPRQMYVNVSFESFYGKYVDPLYVGRMELKNGYISAYYAHTALNPNLVIFHQHFEPYLTTRLLTEIDNRIELEREMRPTTLAEHKEEYGIKRKSRPDPVVQGGLQAFDFEQEEFLPEMIPVSSPPVTRQIEEEIEMPREMNQEIPLNF
ncbi:MAG: hypothetical protein Tsb0021_16840 [Chlamydiales bacterium]